MDNLRQTNRKHTLQAWRILSRPESFGEGQSAVDDLVDDIAAGALDLKEMDQDGSSPVALALRGWDPNEWCSKASPEEVKPVTYPLPGERWTIKDEDAEQSWQRPAAAMIWKGANPFSGWPRQGEWAWGSTFERKWATCGVMAAIQNEAWDVLAQCLEHPNCPPAHDFDSILVSRGRPLLHALANMDRGRKLLLEYGLDPNIANAQGQTPLFLAEDPGAVADFLQAGADPSHVDLGGNDAPAHWGRTMKNAGALMKACIDNLGGRKLQGNGRAVVSSIASNSVKAMSSALEMSGWDISTPVDPKQHPSRRLLPAAALEMIKQTRGGGRPIRLRPIRELLEGEAYAHLWTTKEKAWAATGLSLMQGLSRTDWAFSEASKGDLETLIDKLMEDPKISLQLASCVSPFIDALDLGELDRITREALWAGWMTHVPLPQGGSDPAINGIKAMMDVWGKPGGVAQKAFLDEPRLTGMMLERIFDLGLEELDESALVGILKTYAVIVDHDTPEQFDEAWRRAWENLKTDTPFPTLDAQKMLDWLDSQPEEREKKRGREWRQWAMEVNLQEKLPALPKMRF